MISLIIPSTFDCYLTLTFILTGLPKVYDYIKAYFLSITGTYYFVLDVVIYEEILLSLRKMKNAGKKTQIGQMLSYFIRED